MALINPSSYSGWLQLIRDWLDIVGGDITDTQIAYSLQLAQDELNKILNSPYMEAKSSVTVPSNNAPIPLSGISDFNRVALVTGGSYGQPLDVLAINELMGMQAAVNAGGAAPTQATNYSIFGRQLYIFPAQQAGAAFNVFYYQLVPSLSGSPVLNSNVFTQYHEEALLYAALVACSQYIAEDERVANWAALLKQAVDTINTTAQDSKMGSTPLARQFSVYGGSQPNGGLLRW
jgi:hypothetical protein